MNTLPYCCEDLLPCTVCWREYPAVSTLAILLPVVINEDWPAARPDIPILSKLMIQTLYLVPIKA